MLLFSGGEFMSETQLMDLFNNKRDHKVQITTQAIEKIKNLNIPALSAYDNELIKNMSQLVLKVAATEDNHNEVAITFKLFQNPEDNVEYGIALGSEHHVDPESDSASSKIINMAESGSFTIEANCVVVLTHNHPSLSDISLDDVGYFITKAKLKILIAVTNLGKTFYIMKTNLYDREKAFALLREAIAHNQSATTLQEKQDAARVFLRNASKVGIDYYH